MNLRREPLHGVRPAGQPCSHNDHRTAGRELCRRGELRPDENVLAMRPPAVVPGASEARLSGADRRRGSPGQTPGHDLMRPTREFFRHGSRCRDGTLTRRGFEHLMSPIRDEIDGLLLRGAFSTNPRLTGKCRSCTTIATGSGRSWKSKAWNRRTMRPSGRCVTP